MLYHVINHYILTCGSICGAVQLVYKFFVVQCGMQTELSGAVQFADKNFAHRTISSLENCGFGGKNKTQSFQKLFSGDIFLHLLNIFVTAAQN